MYDYSARAVWLGRIFFFLFMRNFIVTLLMWLVSIPLLHAQSSNSGGFQEFRNKKIAEFEQYKAEKRTEFELFRQRLNKEYAEMIGKQWSSYNQEPEKQPISKPKPDVPEKAKQDAAPGKVTPGAVHQPEKSIPDVPVTIPAPKIVKKSYPVNFLFFNTKCGINRFETSLLSLSGIDNSSLMEAWVRLTADGATDQLIDDCMRLREEMNLCDWGYLMLVEKVAQTLYPNNSDAQAFLTVALLNQSGYDSRLGIVGNKLTMVFHPSHDIYSGSCYVIDGKRYYTRKVIEGQDKRISTYVGDYCQSPTPIRMVMNRYPRFDESKTGPKVFSSAWNQAPSFDVPVNSSVAAFLDAYPIMDWHLYSLADMSPELKTSIIPVFEILTEGLDKVEAVNLILNFHNYAFNYMTDDEQFGREKPFFFEENFFYPYNDCEDRAILFSKIVNKVLGLDVVLLKYPRHLAAAVRFPDGTQIKGTTVNVEGQTYYVCDPTCIGAPAGYLAPQYVNSKPDIYKIKL